MKKISEALDEARSLPDSEFEIKKSEIANGIAPKVKPPKGEKQQEKMVTRLLLNPNMAAYLEQKLSDSGR
jgi:hypothetical protein